VSPRPKDGEHLVTFHPGPHFNFANVRQVFFQFFQDAGTQLPVGHLTSTKPDCRFNLIAVLQPLARMLHPITIVMLVRAGAKLNFLDRNYDLFLLRLVGLFLGQVLELSIVNDFANRRVSVRRDFNQVHALLSGGPDGVTGVHDAEFFPVFGNYAHLWDAYAFVYARGRRATMIRTTTASKTCSYCCTSLSQRVSSSKFQVSISHTEHET